MVIGTWGAQALAVAAAGVATWLAMAPPVSRLRSLAGTNGSGRLRWPAAWRARPDARPLPIRALWGGMVACAGVFLGGGNPLILAVAALAGVATVVILGRLEPAATRRRQERIALDLPQMLALLAACLAAGLPLRSAAACVADVLEGPLAEELHRVHRRLEVGQPETEAWRRLGDSAGAAHLAWLGRDLARSVSSGTAIADALTRNAVDARRERTARVEARAKAIGVRSVLPMMVCFLPAFMLVGVVPVVAGAVLTFFF